MALFSNSNNNNPKEKKHSGILGFSAVDVIKWEPEDDKKASIIVHKYEYEDFINGSYLTVGPSQMAIFTNHMNAALSSEDGAGGRSQFMTFVGPCKIKLETGDGRFAPFRNLSHTLSGGESAFHSTVYFVNTTYMNELSWGTHAPVVVTDPEENVNVHVRAHGLFGVHIEQVDSVKAEVQAKKFLQKVVGTRSDYTRDELVDFMRAKILEYVPNLLANQIVKERISVLKISAYLTEFSGILYRELDDHFDEFGLTLDNFSFHSINVPDSDLKVINDAKIQRTAREIEARANATAMDIESEAIARKRAREGYSYQEEQTYKVMHSAAENEGSASGLMNVGRDIVMGTTIGGMLSRNMNTLMQNTMETSGINEKAQQKSGQKECPECGNQCVENAKFCHVCGHQFIQKENLCPSCGEKLMPGAKFCAFCGQRISTTCAKCGAELMPGAKFCLECGTKI